MSENPETIQVELSEELKNSLAIIGITPEEYLKKLAQSKTLGTLALPQRQPIQPFEKPTIKVKWFRFPNDPAANLGQAVKEPGAFCIYGGTGKGKSALAENLANNYKTIIDLFGSRDNEALSWCRSQRKNSILFLKGETVDISSEWDCKNIKDVTLKDIDSYDAVISCASFYSTLHEEWEGLTALIDKIWHRSGWKNAWSVLIREAANLLYARQALGDNQSVAKSHITYVVREARHVGIALAFDSVRWYSLDIDIRSIAKYTFIKAQGIDGLPDSLHFLYQYFDPYGIMRMGPEKFVIISRDGPLGTGTFTLPSWHKLEHENLMEMLNIQVETIGASRLPDGKPATVTDFEHKNIMTERMSTDPITKKHPGQIKIGKKLNRSSATISLHIKYHNNTILKDGECDKCRRSKCEYSKTLMPTV